ncbi:GTPase-activating protein gyp1 [Hyaloraphidium curvatum]|nr:GTPase-activating protein gyp1 [Hyaloraphidium curvatum]
MSSVSGLNEHARPRIASSRHPAPSLSPRGTASSPRVPPLHVQKRVADGRGAGHAAAVARVAPAEPVARVLEAHADVDARPYPPLADPALKPQPLQTPARALGTVLDAPQPEEQQDAYVEDEVDLGSTRSPRTGSPRTSRPAGLPTDPVADKSPGRAGSEATVVADGRAAEGQPAEGRPGEVPAKPAPPDPRQAKFLAVLDAPNVDMGGPVRLRRPERVSLTAAPADALRNLSWSGIPDPLRARCWQLLTAYLPANADRRPAVLARKRREYSDLAAQALRGPDSRTLHQIRIDLERSGGGVPWLEREEVRKGMERMLYCWAVRHPASGYVQGIHDLAAPFYSVFLASMAGVADANAVDFPSLDPSVLPAVEADSFWCLSLLLDGIQDNYTFAQPGIQRGIVRLRELVGRIDAPLGAHLRNEGVEFVQFAFRWMNCLLMREVPLACIVRMWDTYLSEPDGFSEFHLYVCAAFLVKWSERLRAMDFQDAVVFLQRPPTEGWTARDVELLLSEAYMWKSLFLGSPSHLRGAS